MAENMSHDPLLQPMTIIESIHYYLMQVEKGPYHRQHKDDTLHFHHQE